MAIKIQVVVLWIMTSCSIALGYQCFGGPCCLHLQGPDVVVTLCIVAVRYHCYERCCCFHLHGR